MPAFSFDEIIKQIKSKKAHPVYVLQGAEAYFVDLLTECFQNELLSEDEKAFNQDVYFGKETSVSTIVDALSQYPMGSDLRLVLVRNAHELKNIDQLADYASAPYASSVLVLSLPGKTLDGRKKLGTLVKNNYALYESKTIYENQLPAWIRSQVEKHGKSISEQNAQLIADYLGTDLKKISNEIEKTVIAIGASTDITQQHIEDFIGINREFNVFELVNAIFNRNPVKAQLIVEYLSDNMNKQPLVLILGSMFNSFLKLYLLKVKSPKNDQDISALIGTRSISAIREYKTALGNFQIADLDYAMYLFKRYDQYSKGIDYTLGDDGQLLKELVFQLIHLSSVRAVK